MAIPEVIQGVWKALTESKRFDRVLNEIQLIAASNGNCTAELTVSEEHTNLNGTLHGGLSCTLVDVISGVALSTHKTFPDRGVSVDLHVSFMNAAQIGERIVIEARTNKVGRVLAFLEVDIFNKSTKKPIAFGIHTKYVAPPQG